MFSKFMFRRVLALMLFLGALEAGATDGLFTGIHHHYQAPRAMGMGDAFVAVANDYSAMFYNPAGLGRVDESQMNLSMEFGLSSSYVSFVNDATTASNIKDETEKRSQLTSLLQKNYGNIFAARLGLAQGIWLSPHWSFGILPMDLTMEYSVQDQGFPSINSRMFLDSTIAFGYGTEIRDIPVGGRLYWGSTVKFINRGYFSKQFSVIDLVVDKDLMKTTDLREGYTVDADLGLMYVPFLATDGFWSLFRLARPTFGLVVRNVADYGFKQSLNVYNKNGVKTEAPEKLNRVVDIGTKWEYPSFWIFGGRGVMDFRDIGHPNWNFRKGFHGGFEFDWSMFSWWKGQYRIGLNQGYLTAGASALFAVFRLDLVTYGEDVGSYSNPRESRVYALKLNIDW